MNINRGPLAADGKRLSRKMSALGLVGPLICLAAAPDLCRGVPLRIWVDNAGSVRVWQKGYSTRCALCNTLFKALATVAAALGSRVDIQKIRRCSTPGAVLADALSKGALAAVCRFSTEFDWPLVASTAAVPDPTDPLCGGWPTLSPTMISVRRFYLMLVARCRCSVLHPLLFKFLLWNILFRNTTCVLWFFLGNRLMGLWRCRVRVLIDYLPSCFNSVVSEAAFLRRPGRLSAPVMLLYTWVLLGGLLLFIMSYFVFFYSSFFDLFIFIFSRYSFIYVSRHLAAACTTRSCSWRIRRREAAG